MSGRSAFDTPLGKDVLLAERVVIREMVNDLFAITVHVRSKRSDLKPSEIVGKLHRPRCI